jgi:hypothetical protein
VDALDVFAEEVVVDTHRRLAVTTELTGATGDAGGDGDVVAGCEPGDAVADLTDDAGGVAPGDVWHLEVDPGDVRAAVGSG